MSITAVGSSTNYAELTSRMSKEGHHGDLTIEPFMAEQVAKEKKAPYSSMAENGMITYKGVTFVCDDDNQCLCLGDMTDEKNVLTIPLEKGGSLNVNRNNLGDLSHAIGMFSPEDVNRILSAIAQNNQCTQKMFEIEDMENGGNGDLNERF